MCTLMDLLLKLPLIGKYKAEPFDLMGKGLGWIQSGPSDLRLCRQLSEESGRQVSGTGRGSVNDYESCS